MNEDLIYIGEQIRKERKAQNLSQECLAELADTPQNNISRTELGSHAPKIDSFISICEALSVSPNQLLPERLSANDRVSGDAFHIGYRLERLDSKKKKEALQAIDAILKMAGV